MSHLDLLVGSNWWWPAAVFVPLLAGHLLLGGFVRFAGQGQLIDIALRILQFDQGE